MRANVLLKEIEEDLKLHLLHQHKNKRNNLHTKRNLNQRRKTAGKKLKEKNPPKYEELQEYERKRSQFYRLEMTEKEQELSNRLAAIRQRRYRQKKKKEEARKKEDERKKSKY